MITEVTSTTYVAYQLLQPFLLSLTEESVMPVDVRDPQNQANDASAGAFSFFYFDIVKVIVNFEDERIETSSDRRNITKTYYIDAELLTSDQLAALPGDHSDMLSKMRRNGWDTILRCRTGNFQHFKADEHELITTS